MTHDRRWIVFDKTGCLLESFSEHEFSSPEEAAIDGVLQWGDYENGTDFDEEDFVFVRSPDGRKHKVTLRWRVVVNCESVGTEIVE